MSLVDAFLAPLTVLSPNRDAESQHSATQDASATALRDNTAIVRSPGAGGSCAYSSPTLVARRGRGNAADTSSGSYGLDQDGLALTADQTGQASPAGVDSQPPRSSSGPAAGSQMPGTFFAGHETSQQKTGSGVRSPVDMTAKTSWLGDSPTEDDDDSKKGRGKLGSPWQLNHARDNCRDSIRMGLRSLTDAYTRKRQPLGLRLLLVVLLTGFITVMVSYKSFTPSTLKQDLLNPKEMEQEDAASQGAGVLGAAQALSAGFGLQWGASRGLKSNSNGVSDNGNAARDWSGGQARGRAGRVSMFSLPHGPPRAGGTSRNQPSAGTGGPLSFFSTALGWMTLGIGAAQASEEPEGIPARILAVPEKERELWLPPKSDSLQICIQRRKNYKEPHPVATNGYLIVTANGGLNQMRAAICDMVAVARIMNVTLVVPQLDHSSFWADPSNFEDIFQLDHFVSELAKDIRIVKELPESHRDLKPLEIRPVSWSPFKYYKKDLLAKLKKHKVMVFPLTDSRLANNKLPESIQRLRCRANYRALKYSPEIETVASNLIQRLRSKGPYIALHLRYEKDMLAFTGCTHGLSPEESEELRVMRLNNSRWKEKEIDGEVRRTDGLCPLTPGETALFLRAMGFPNTSVIYIAAGNIFGSHGLTDLTTLYPNTFTHSTLATPEELQSLERYQNRMAAVDYTVAVESDVFAYTYEGNMARAVQGHRRFEGHRKTIIPERRLVVKYIDLFSQGLISWGAFRRSIRQAHADRMGGPHLRLTGLNPKSEENFFANPYPGCICEGGPSKSVS